MAFCCLSSQVFAAGFQVQEQNVTNLGTAYSGTAALAEDASTGYFNPAGLVRIRESQLVLGATVIQGDFHFTAHEATTSLTGNTMGTGEADPGRTALVPNFHIAKRLDERWVLSASVTTPFGLSTRYNEESIARYIATDSNIYTVNFGPSLAYELLPCLSIGAGVDAQWVKADLSAKFGENIYAFEGYQRNHAQGWGYGYHVGALWQPFKVTRVGLNYRSNIPVHLNGTSENQTSLGYVLPKLHTEATLPETATLSIYQRLSDRLALTVDAAWTNWSRFRTLRLRYERPINTVNPINGFPLVAPDTDTFEHFKDTGRYALGFTYDYNQNWLMRLGVAYDETPVTDSHRTARLPDADRYWLAVGGAYLFNNDLRVDFGYAHLFFKDVSIHDHAPFAAQTTTPVNAARLTGDYSSNANILGIQIRYDFV